MADIFALDFNLRQLRKRKITHTLGVSFDYLLGKSDKAVLNKKLMRRIEEIEAFSEEQKEKIYYFLNMAIRDARAKQAYGA